MSTLFKSLWDRLLFQDRGILPTPKFLIAFAILSCAMIVSTFWGVSWTVVFIGNMLFILVSFVDLSFSPRRSQLSFTRSMESKLERGKPYTVKLQINNDSGHPITYQLVDGLPLMFESPFPLRGTVVASGGTEVSYSTVALVRGKYEVGPLYVRYASRFGYWQKQTTASIHEWVKVIPDLTETKRYLENAQKFLLHEGVKPRRRRSGAGEFSKIRSYAVGDDLRMINWRQTAKLMDVMTNEYEPEHGKHITLLIDCGRMMGAELKKGNRLERALEACLTVAAAALQKGDYVAVVAFSDQVKAYVPPQKGIDHLQMILNTLYHIQVDEIESNYAGILQYLENIQKKRSLLLLFSDVGTFLHEESALIYLNRLKQRHLFMMIGIQDETLQERVQESPEHVHQAIVKSMAQQQTLIKKRKKLKWEKQGLLMVEAREERLAEEAVSHYIDMLNKGML